jgi:predicted murein hydrolase (TIGR00659 family)
MNDVHNLWVYLSASPLLHLTLTLIAYQFGEWLSRRTRRHPLCNPVLIAIVVLVAVLKLTDTDYKNYFSGAQFVHFLLGPATVALAIPLYHAYEHIRSSAAAIVVALVSGCLFAALSAIAVGYACGGSMVTLLSLAPKSATTPIAMGVADAIGGSASLTAILVILTGIFGAMLSTWVLDLARVKDNRARGFATGLAAHGIGTAYKLRVNQVAGAFAGLAMGLNGFATAALVPILVHWLRL